MSNAFTDLQTPAGFLALLWPDATFDGWLTFFAKGVDGKPVTAAFHRSMEFSENFEGEGV